MSGNNQIVKRHEAEMAKAKVRNLARLAALKKPRKPWMEHLEEEIMRESKKYPSWK